MANYYSSIPVQFSETTSGTEYVLVLDSDPAAGAVTVQPSDTVTADTTGTSVQTSVSAATGAPPLTGVVAVSLDGAPSVSFTPSNGVYTAYFPASAATDYSWRIEVSIDPEGEDREQRGTIVLDPILIVRKTN